MNDSEYEDKMKRKRQLAEKNGLYLIIIEPINLFNLDEELRILTL